MTTGSNQLRTPLKEVEHHFFKHDQKKVIEEIGKEKLLEDLKQMMLTRNFDIRAEAAYQQGKVGGFFHASIGQEVVSISCVRAMGKKNWWIASYRCHALALVLGATPKEIMAELYGKASGNAKGRGGSMHLYTDRMLGGFGIVAGQVPVATGAAFSLKYKKNKDEVAVCFLGDGAVAQGVFHESLNLASLWDLPCIYVIENNKWGMGTAFTRAICVDHLAEDRAPAYNMNGYTLDGMDYFNCAAGFQHIHQEVLNTGRPVLVEAVTERFRGHSISDPGAYRTKDELKMVMSQDPLLKMQHDLMDHKIIDEEGVKQMDKETRAVAVEAMKYAEESSWPDIHTLEEDVYAP